MLKEKQTPSFVMLKQLQSQWQFFSLIGDLERLFTDNSNFTIRILCYRHLMLEDRHPAIMGPILIHQQSKFSSFNYFFSILISANKQLRNVLAVGTDGDESICQAVTVFLSF